MEDGWLIIRKLSPKLIWLFSVELIYIYSPIARTGIFEHPNNTRVSPLSDVENVCH